MQKNFKRGGGNSKIIIEEIVETIKIKESKTKRKDEEIKRVEDFEIALTEEMKI